MMVSKFSKVGVWVLPVLAFVVSCGSATVDSDKVDESTYFREMSVDYNAATNSTDAEMQFSVSGFHYGFDSATTIRLVEPSSVRINNKLAGFHDARHETDLLGAGSYYYADLSSAPKPI